MLHQLIKHDWLDHDFIDNHTSGFEDAASAVKNYDLEVGRTQVTGIAKEKIMHAAEWWGPGEDELSAARARN